MLNDILTNVTDGLQQEPGPIEETEKVTYPSDFPVPQDTGGPGAGQPLGGFGGNPAADAAAHRELVARVGKAPVLLVHGNAGAADVRPWDLLDQKRFLLAAGYSDELIWAPSYLGPGAVDLQTPHTNNIDDVRAFAEAVCSYLAVDVVDVIAHSLGCTLMYSLCRGLDRQNSPITWNQPKKWNRVGTLVSLAGAFHGLGAGSIGEWRTGGEFMNELLAETVGGGGETPFAAGKPQTDGANPHNISYFCGVAAGDFVDAQNPGTGRLSGAVNRSYNLGSGQAGHQAIKESQAVFNDFLPLLNLVPPVPAVTLTLDRESGSYAAPLTVTVTVDPADLEVGVQAVRVTKQFVNGYIVDTVAETRDGTLRNGQSLTLETAGYWQVTASTAAAVDPVVRHYWVDVEQLVAAIVTDNNVPFDGSLLVSATTSSPTATLYSSLDGGATWSVGATVTITEDALVSFIAIDMNGVASEVVSRLFTKRVPWDDAVTASAVDHFVAGRIDVNEYLAYSDQFGFLTPFTLYLVSGEWVLDPQQPVQATLFRQSTEPAAEITVVTADPAPGAYPAGPLTVTIVAADSNSEVAYTLDGLVPTSDSPVFAGSKRFEFAAGANSVVICTTTDPAGRPTYHAFAYSIER